MRAWMVKQYRSDHHGAYALLEDSAGNRMWRFRDYAQYGHSDNKGAIFELGQTRDYSYEKFESMIDLIEHIHELAKDWVLITEEENKKRITERLAAFARRGWTLNRE